MIILFILYVHKAKSQDSLLRVWQIHIPKSCYSGHYLMRSGPDCSEPLVSNRFDFLEIDHRIRMAPEVELQTLHILHLPR